MKTVIFHKLLALCSTFGNLGLLLLCFQCIFVKCFLCFVDLCDKHEKAASKLTIPYTTCLNSLEHGRQSKIWQVGLCLEGQLFDPRPCHLCHGRCFHWQDTLPTLPRVNVSDCCMREVVVRGALGAEWQPRFRQSAPDY